MSTHLCTTVGNRAFSSSSKTFLLPRGEVKTFSPLHCPMFYHAHGTQSGKVEHTSSSGISTIASSDPPRKQKAQQRLMGRED